MFLSGGFAMENKIFNAFVVEESDEKTFAGHVRKRSLTDLPEGEVTIRVNYSSLNYKDALSATGNRGVTKTYPHTPGIDAAGYIEESSIGRFKTGDPVICTSYDLGMNTPGGFGQVIRVPADWIVKLPSGLTLRESMIFGTAGFTAGLSVRKLTASVKPEQGPVLVTGATGGVGSIAVAILAKLGYSVTAVSGKTDAEVFLRSMGVREIISREAFSKDSSSPLLRPVWAGAIDTVGGEFLATAIKSTMPLGVVTCCGNAASPQLPITVFPFILRGVTLAGVNSQSCPMPIRKEVWGKLADEWKFDRLEDICTEISLEALSEKVPLILKGQLKGRTVVNLER